MATNPPPAGIQAAIEHANAALAQRDALWQQIDEAVAAAAADLDAARNTADALYPIPTPDDIGTVFNASADSIE